MAKTFEYTGVEVLEAVSYAKNYNRSLLDIVEKEVRKSTKKPIVVDFGSGSGMYAAMMQEQLSIRPLCVELDKKLREATQKAGFESYKSIKDLPKKADIIYSLNVFEHIEDDAKIRREIYSSMKNNSTHIVYVPAFQVLYSSMDRLAEHYRRYRKPYLRKILEDAGFEVEHIKYADPLGFFAALAFRIFGNKEGKLSPTGVKIFDKFLFPVSKALQPLTSHLFGKNVCAVARKKGVK